MSFMSTQWVEILVHRPKYVSIETRRRKKITKTNPEKLTKENKNLSEGKK